MNSPNVNSPLGCSPNRTIFRSLLHDIAGESCNFVEHLHSEEMKRREAGLREYGILRRNLRGSVEAAGYKRWSSSEGYKEGTTRVGFWISQVLAQDFTSAATRRDGQCVIYYGLEALFRKANFLMVARRRRLCVGWFLAGLDFPPRVRWIVQRECSV